jgi:hypothetical protein
MDLMMILIQTNWLAWLGLEKRSFKFLATPARTSIPSGYNIINYFFVLEMLRRLASAAADATFFLTIKTYYTMVNTYCSVWCFTRETI